MRALPKSPTNTTMAAKDVDSNASFSIIQPDDDTLEDEVEPWIDYTEREHTKQTT